MDAATAGRRFDGARVQRLGESAARGRAVGEEGDERRTGRDTQAARRVCKGREMRFLDLWVATPLARSIGWTLIHSLWEGAAISAALALVLSLTHSARVRYGAACAAMVVLLGAVAVTFIRMMPTGRRGANEVPLILPPWSAHALLPTSAQAPLSVAAAVPWLAPLWILGVWLFVLAQAAGWISVSRLRARGVCSAPERWQNKLLGLCALVRVARPVRLLESCLAEVPMVIGHIRPVILMPVG